MKKETIGIFCGLLVLFIGSVITSTANLLLFTSLSRSIGPEHFFTQLNNPPYNYFTWLISIAGISFTIFAGLSTGLIAKRNGLILGVLLGLIVLLFRLALVGLALSFPNIWTSGGAYQRQILELNISRQFYFSMPESLNFIIETTTGGLLWELYRRFLPNKKHPH